MSVSWPFFLLDRNGGPHRPRTVADGGCCMCRPAPKSKCSPSVGSGRWLNSACPNEPTPSLPPPDRFFLISENQSVAQAKTQQSKPPSASCSAVGVLCCPYPLQYTQHLVMSPTALFPLRSEPQDPEASNCSPCRPCPSLSPSAR